ncbi:uncharacterized protein TNCV_3355221 [Trichonephila clavipes]|nr:uncharacterized protein TNCV_3355221 [Trichonephila clavipes]
MQKTGFQMLNDDEIVTSVQEQSDPVDDEMVEDENNNNESRKATRGLLATDHVILNHGQVTWTTPELAPPLLTTTPHQREDVSALDRFNVHRCPTRRVFSGTGFEPVTKQATVRYLYHSATAATFCVRDSYGVVRTTECCPTQLLLLKRIRDHAAKKRRIRFHIPHGSHSVIRTIVYLNDVRFQL